MIISKIIPNVRVFIVHGHDQKALKETKQMIRRFKLVPIILSERPGKSRTIIEKLEEEAKDINYAVVLLTPDDKRRLKGKSKLNKRVRQNVIFEMGYFFGKLGRKKVFNLLKGDVEKPSDIEGISYLPYKKSVKELKRALRKEFQEVSHIFEYKPILSVKKVKTPARAKSKEKAAVKTFNEGVDFYKKEDLLPSEWVKRT